MSGWNDKWTCLLPRHYPFSMVQLADRFGVIRVLSSSPTTKKRRNTWSLSGLPDDFILIYVELAKFSNITAQFFQEFLLNDVSKSHGDSCLNIKIKRQVSSMIHFARPTISPVTNIVFAWNWTVGRPRGSIWLKFVYFLATLTKSSSNAMRFEFNRRGDLIANWLQSTNYGKQFL